MPENLVGPEDQICDLVTELLDDGVDAHRILDAAKEAVREWKMRRREKSNA